MKERPIIFSAPMVRAILEGRKTQTRRIVKNQWAEHAIRVHANSKMTEFDFVLSDQTGRIEFCKHGQPGDRLWVRETWALSGRCADAKVSDYQIPEVTLSENLVYFADDDDYDKYVQSWRPSIHMPRWASRIDLEITGIRVERLNEISEKDAINEGIVCPPLYADEPIFDCRLAYQLLWESINGEGSWDKNPWVWVIEFKRINQD